MSNLDKEATPEEKKIIESIVVEGPKLPTKSEALRIFGHLLDKGRSKDAAEFAFCFVISKTDPKKFADGLIAIAKRAMVDPEYKAKLLERVRRF